MQQKEHATLTGDTEGHTPDFSICIPAYENVAAFSRCLESVLKQHTVNMEIIVSDDSSGGAIKEHVAQLGDTRVRYVHNSPAFGVPENWNAVLGLAKGRVVTLLHQDDWYRTPDVLATIYEAMNSSDAEVLLVGRALYQKGACLGEYKIRPGLPARFLRGFPAQSLVVNRLGHPSVFFFKSKLKTVTYDESLTYFADTDYYNRLLGEAQRVEVCSTPLIGIMRGEQGQLSQACLAAPELLLDELFRLHEKYQLTTWDKGVTLSRFIVSHIRHLSVASIGIVFAVLWKRLPAGSFCLVWASAPFFALHMLYRFFYRIVLGKHWS